MRKYSNLNLFHSIKRTGVQKDYKPGGMQTCRRKVHLSKVKTNKQIDYFFQQFFCFENQIMKNVQVVRPL
jgi:hypothetical protein